MNITTVFYDMDGVLCDWHRSAAKLFGTTKEDVLKKWTPGSFCLRNIIGLTDEEMWRVIDAEGSAFWANLDVLPGAREIWALGHDLGKECHVLTCPSDHPASSAGKVEWLHKFMGKTAARNRVLTANKHLCAAPDRLLIDDSTENVEKFREFGGKAILYPAIWNAAWRDTDRALEVVVEEMKRMLS